MLATLTTLVPYAFSAAAELLLCSSSASASGRASWCATTHRRAGVRLQLWAIAGAGDDIVTKGFVLLLAGIPVYVCIRWWQKRLRR